MPDLDFNPLFEPKTAAIIGVSLTNDLHPANVIYAKNRLRYPVRIFAVNPKGGRLLGDQVYPSVAAIPERIDLAIIAVKAELVPLVLRDCIAAGARAAAVISGGFAESGQNGRNLQDEVKRIADEAGLPLVGPNCLGIFSPRRVDTFFLPSERMVQPLPGDVAVISQSGGILVDTLVKFADEGIGLSRAISIGNKAVLREIDFLSWFANDPKTKVIAFYVEGFGKNEGRAFVEAAARCPKPVIVLKAGKTPGGMRAVSSHTASLAGDYAVFSAALAQHGVVEAKNEYELVSFCEALSCYQQPISGRIGIISGSGGHAALAVDVCTDHGLATPTLSDETQKAIIARLSPSIQPIAAVGNPIDLTGSALEGDFVAVAETMSKIDEIDCLIVLMLPYLPGISSDLGARLSQVAHRSGKPLIAYVPHIEKYRMLIEGFELNRVPVAASIAGAVQMAEAMRRIEPC